MSKSLAKMATNNLDAGMKCMKYMLLSVTAMFAVTSALIISVGTTIFAFYHDFSFFMEAHYFTPATLVVVIGALMLAVSLFGCVGAIKESTCLVNMFALMLTGVLVMEFSAAIATYRLRNQMPALVDARVRDSLGLYVEDLEVKDAFDFVQSQLNCCGMDDYLDWGQLAPQLDGHGIEVSNITVPYSCCATSQFSDQDGVQTASCVELYANGCLPRLVYLVSQSAGLLGTGAMTIALIQLIGIAFSLMLAKAIRQAKSERERRRWEIREQMMNAASITYPGLDYASGKTTPVVYVPDQGHTVA